MCETYQIKLHFMKYDTMNSWNNSTAPAFNLKVYNVIPKKLQNKVFELMKCADFYEEINYLIKDFDLNNDYQWQAGFNGRSGGYLVLYSGGCKRETYTKEMFKNDNVYISDRIGWKSYSEALKMGIINKPIITSIFSYPGREINFRDVPRNVLEEFKNLAIGIVSSVIDLAKNFEVEEEKYLVERTRKIIVEK